MPVYRWDTTKSPPQWSPLVSTSLTTGPNVYVKTSGTTGGMTTTNSRRVRNIYAHNGTTWQKVYQAFLPAPPAPPATPTNFRTATGWDTRVDSTKLQFSSVPLPSGATQMVYWIEAYSGSNKDVYEFMTSVSHDIHPTTVTVDVPLPEENKTYWFRCYAQAFNAVQFSTDGGSTAFVGVKSGTTQGSWSGGSDQRNLTDGVLYSVTAGSGTDDQYITGTTTITELSFLAEQNVAMYPPLMSEVDIAGPYGINIFLVGYENGQVGRELYENVGISLVGAQTWVVNPIAGWGGSLRIAWSGVRTTRNSSVRA